MSFNPEVIAPHDIKHYTFWNELNRFYGAVEVNTKLAHEHKATIEFEPGMYNNIQMKAIRDEYVKLPSIRFGWVMGKTAIQVDYWGFCLNFQSTSGELKTKTEIGHGCWRIFKNVHC